MSKLKQDINLSIILFLILTALIFVYLVEHKLGYQPCKLCIYQRIPYFLAIFLIIEILFYKKYVKSTLLILTLIFFLSFCLAFYHFGIEQGFFSGGFICESENLEKILSKEQLLEQLKKNAVSCKDVYFKFLGFSLASINAIVSLILSFIMFKLFTNYGKN
jgi:disulfide bond formation protein DsbB